VIRLKTVYAGALSKKASLCNNELLLTASLIQYLKKLYFEAIRLVIIWQKRFINIHPEMDKYGVN